MAGRPRLLTPAQEQELIQWWLSPRTVYEKAQELRISTSTLTDYLIRNGMTIRSTWRDKPQLSRAQQKFRAGKMVEPHECISPDCDCPEALAEVVMPDGRTWGSVANVEQSTVDPSDNS